MKYAIGVDIGGTKMEVNLVTTSYTIVTKKRVSTPQGRKEFLEQLCKLINECNNKNVKGIGISLPDYVSPKGIVGKLAKIQSLRGFNLRRFLEKKYKKNIVIKNDADCFAKAEQIAGAGKGKNHVIGVIIGTGVGAGLVLNGQLYQGTKGYVGEFGHTIITGNAGPVCRCGIQGHAEAWFSGPNIVQRYVHAGGKMKEPNPSKIFSSKEKVARSIAKETIEKMAMAMAMLWNLLDPELIVIGGGVSHASFYAALNKETRKYVIIDHVKDVRIVRNKLGDAAGAIGAAALILE